MVSKPAELIRVGRMRWAGFGIAGAVFSLLAIVALAGGDIAIGIVLVLMGLPMAIMGVPRLVAPALFAIRVDGEGLTWRGLLLRRRHIPRDKIEGFKSETVSGVGANGQMSQVSMVQVLGARGRRLGGLGPGLRGGGDDAAKRLEALRERHQAG